MAELIGRMLGQYQITAALGEGGMATVYRAHQSSVSRDVAIKVIRSHLAQNSDFVTRFKREAKTIASLDHPHILKVHDFGQVDDLIYLVMELKTGGTLANQIVRTELPLNTIAALLMQIASALDYAHELGIIHRDLKPQNVLLDERGNAFLTDFGIAKLVQSDHTALTQSGTAMGTPAYMSPEQWQGRALDARSDLYALGIMLYEMLTGQVPFRADTPASMMYAHLEQNPPSPRQLRPTLPRDLDSVIEIVLAKSPAARFQTAQSLADAFNDAINGKPIVTPAKSPRVSASGSVPISPVPAPKRGIVAPLIAAGGLVALFVIGGAILASQRGNSNTVEATTTQVAALATNTVSASSTELPTSPTIDTRIIDIAAATQQAQLASQTVVATSTSTLTVTPIDPLDYVNQTFVARTEEAVATIAAYTKTPTLTSTSTPNYEHTAAAIVAATDAQATAKVIASYTKTPTPTNTFTDTATPTPTYTLTPTPTKTPTNMPPTPTYTLTPTPTEVVLPSNTPMLLPTLIPAGATLAWQVVERDFNGVAMVLVPAGCFNMGSNDGYDNEKPVHTVCITRSFWIDKYEVTNEQFNRLNGQAHRPSNWTDPLRPRGNITWDEADAFCKGRNAALPTEAQWEYAARSPQSLVYPWGNTFIADNVVYFGNSPDRIDSVGSKLGGVAWVGAYDLIGNAEEWIADWYATDYYKSSETNDPIGVSSGQYRVMRGGWIYNFEYDARATLRFRLRSDVESVYLGFRCASPAIQ